MTTMTKMSVLLAALLLLGGCAKGQNVNPHQPVSRCVGNTDCGTAPQYGSNTSIIPRDKYTEEIHRRCLEWAYSPFDGRQSGGRNLQYDWCLYGENR